MNLGQTIYYLQNNKLHSAPVLSKLIVENAWEDLASTKDQKEIFTQFGEERIIYATCHGQFFDYQVFKTPEALFAHILKGSK